MTINLPQSLAARMIVGLRGDRLNDLLATGVGGLIAFRSDCQAIDNIQAFHQHIKHLKCQRPPDALPMALMVDQEGGPVERLGPPWVPALPSYRAMALAPNPRRLIARAVAAQSRALRRLGFTLNAAPVLDVNTEPANPVIGVRSFGAEADTVRRLGQVVIDSMQQAGLLPVAKHFPGHGGGLVDSHDSLPVLPLNETHLYPFRHAVQAGVPAIMLSHGYYPGWCENERTPASLSSQVVQGLLRGQLGYDGLVMTDDLQMGAIALDPVAAALRAVEAGADVLLYREAGEREWTVLQALTQAYATGRLPLAMHKASLARLRSLNARQRRMTSLDPSAVEMADEDAYWLSVTLARACLPVASPGFDRSAALHVFHPDPAALPQYAWSTDLLSLPQALRHAGFHHVISHPYQPDDPPTALGLDLTLQTAESFIRVAIAPCRDPHEAAWQAFLQPWQNAPHLQACLYWPDDHCMLLPGYRPASIAAFAQWLGVCG